jgi:hypothetical protein
MRGEEIRDRDQRQESRDKRSGIDHDAVLICSCVLISNLLSLISAFSFRGRAAVSYGVATELRDSATACFAAACTRRLGSLVAMR